MIRPLPDLTQALLDAARKAGADQADAIAVSANSIHVDIRNGALEQAERSEGTDLGLRVLVGRRQACVSASDTRDATIAEMAERAVAMAREAPEDPYAGLADPGEVIHDGTAEGLDLCDPAEEPAPATLQEMAARAEAAAQGNAGVSQVQSASAGYGARQFHIAATNGFSGGYGRTSTSVSCVAISGEGLGMERDYDGDSRIYATDLRSPEDIGTRAAERAVARAGSRKPATGAYPVLFDERISSSLVGHVLAAASGSAVARGSSWLRGKLGDTILPETLSITEDPHRPRVGNSRLFDAEGLPTRRRDIVRDGVLQGWTMDLGTARQMGLTSTANATRGTSAPPSPSTWNIALTQGPASREALLRDMGAGLLVTSLIGATINPNTGDYSRGASGFWIENGEIAYPVNECTIAGNLLDFLPRMTPANDARAWLSTVVPSLLVEGLTLAGN